MSSIVSWSPPPDSSSSGSKESSNISQFVTLLKQNPNSWGKLLTPYKTRNIIHYVKNRYNTIEWRICKRSDLLFDLYGRYSNTTDALVAFASTVEPSAE